MKPALYSTPLNSAALNAKAPLTLAASLSAVRLKLWDEEAQQLVAFD